MNLSFFRIFVLVIFTIFIGNTVMAQILYDFNTESKLENWFIVNDDVMGGVSKSKLFLDYEGNGVFKGRISTLNNGGFASVRFNCGRVISKNKKNIVIRIKGDKKKYQIRIKSNRCECAGVRRRFRGTCCSNAPNAGACDWRMP